MQVCQINFTNWTKLVKWHFVDEYQWSQRLLKEPFFTYPDFLILVVDLILF